MLGYAQEDDTKPAEANGDNVLASSFGAGAVRLTRSVVFEIFPVS